MARMWRQISTGARPDARHCAAGLTRGWSWPVAGGLAAVTLWGLAPVATRAAVAHLAPVPLLVLRLTAAALVLLPWAMPVLRRLRLRSLGRLLAAGTLGLIGYNLPVTIGVQLPRPATRQRTSNASLPGLRPIANTRTSNTSISDLLELCVTASGDIGRAVPRRRPGHHLHGFGA